MADTISVRGHDWDEWNASPLSVLANVSPAERVLIVDEANRWCRRCGMYESRPATEAEQEQAIAVYLGEAEKEWADPQKRRHLERIGRGQNGGMKK